MKVSTLQTDIVLGHVTVLEELVLSEYTIKWVSSIQHDERSFNEYVMGGMRSLSQVVLVHLVSE